MWPGEHVVLGYLAYSLFCHLRYGDPPDGPGAFVATSASLLPDLVDKPLAWSLGVVQSGHAIAHSVFFAVPLAMVVVAWSHSRGHVRTGVAFALGYLLHLPADIYYQYAVNDTIEPEMVLWPVRTLEQPPTRAGFVGETIRRIGELRLELLAGDISQYMWMQFALMGTVAVLWLFDGAPVLREILLGSKSVAESVLHALRT